MSLCQSEKNSCGACCGILNLDLSKKDVHQLIVERTSQFNEIVNFSNRGTISEFRQKREEIEKKFKRVNEEIYVCPYLGFIKKNRIGCMIHPSISGDPYSQNFSFYGTSICQGYECKNKSGEVSEIILQIIDSIIQNSYYEYSNLSGDHILMDLICKFFLLDKEPERIKNRELLELVKDLILRKFNLNKNVNITSFELEYEVGNIFEKLVIYLEIKPEEELYKRLIEIFENPSRGFAL